MVQGGAVYNRGVSGDTLQSTYRLAADGSLLLGARQVASPNCDDRPAGCTIDLVVLHGISLPPDEYGGPWIDRLFTNTLAPDAHPYFREIEGLEVSSHLLIRRDGEVVQYVPFHRRAWHAGASCWEGRERCNDFSVGIELEGSDLVPYEERQYRALHQVLKTVLPAWSLTDPSRVVGHCHIAPGRKSDPGPAFDWPRVRRMVEEIARLS